MSWRIDRRNTLKTKYVDCSKLKTRRSSTNFENHGWHPRKRHLLRNLQMSFMADINARYFVDSEWLADPL